MKYSLLFVTLLFSRLLFAESFPGHYSNTLETDSSCEIHANFWKLDNSNSAVLALHYGDEVQYRSLTLKKDAVTQREYYYTTDDVLPTFEIRMTLLVESSLPGLSVYYSGRYFRCNLNHKFPDYSTSNAGSIGH